MTKSDPHSLDGLVLRFRETMGGHVGIDEPEPLDGAARGQRENTPLPKGINPLTWIRNGRTD